MAHLQMIFLFEMVTSHSYVESSEDMYPCHFLWFRWCHILGHPNHSSHSSVRKMDVDMAGYVNDAPHLF
jgi:hypothetical protein